MDTSFTGEKMADKSLRNPMSPVAAGCEVWSADDSKHQSSGRENQWGGNCLEGLRGALVR